MGIKIDEIVKIILVAAFGGFAGGLVTLIAIRWSTLKNLKTARERLQTQLLYEDKKKALRELYRLVERPYPEFEAKISYFLEGPESEFLPEKLKSTILTEISDLDEFIQERGLAPPEPSGEELLAEYEEHLKTLTDWERAKHELEERIRKLKSAIKSLIRQHIKP